MTHKIKNTFKGLDTDTSINKYSNDKYYDARNIRILTNDSLTSGAISNFPRPDIEISYGGSGRKVLGTTMVRDTLVVFCVHESSGESLILKSEEGNTDFVLVYSDATSTTKLEFNVDNPIRGVGRYESEAVQKVYWCDGLNPNSFINIADTYASGYEANLFRLTPNADLRSPIPQEVISGGLLESGIIYYTYQLYRNYGSETAMSSSSFGVPLTSRNGLELNEFRGDEVGVNTGQSVEVRFNDLDSNFDRIKVYSLLFTDIDADPIINLIADQEYATASITMIDSGSITLDTLSTIEFLGIGGRIFSSKTLETKYNYLFPGNIRESKTDIDFDARTYRWKTTQLENITAPVTFVTDITGDLGFIVDFDHDLKERSDVIWGSVSSESGVNRAYAANELLPGIGIKTYSTYDKVTYNFLVPTDNSTTPPMIPSGTYDISTEYDEGNVVLDSNILYQSLQDSNIGNTPIPAGDAYWKVYIQPSVTTFTSGSGATYCTIDDVNTGILGVEPSDWDTVPDIHDAINYFNDFSLDDEIIRSEQSSTIAEFKYSIDHGTEKITDVGGIGPNISYTFGSHGVEANVTSSLKTGAYLRDIANINNSFLNPINSGKYKGYKRNEVYRFGVEFHFKNGQKSFVKWIGDIRFPTIGEQPLTSINSNIIYNEQLYLDLNIDLSTDLTDAEYNSLSGIKIVRAERKSQDKNILYQGLSGTYQHTDWDNGTTLNSWGSYSVTPNMERVGEEEILPGDTDYPGTDIAHTAPLSNFLYEFNSPELIINKNLNFNGTDKVYFNGALAINHSTSSTSNVPGSGIEQPYFKERNYADRNVLVFNFISDLENATLSKHNFDGSTNAGHSYFSGEVLNNRTIMYRTSSDDNAIRDLHGVLSLDVSDNDPSNRIKFTHTAEPNATDTLLADYIKVRFESQYGGHTYPARQLTSYTSTICDVDGDFVEFIPISEFTNKEISLKVFGGDTYVSNFDYMRSTVDREAPNNGYTIQEYITFPVESSYNLDYRRDEIIKYFTGDSEAAAASNENYKLQVLKSRGVEIYPTLYPDQLTDLNLYNDAYSRNNDITTNTIRPDNFQTDFTLDTMVLASNKKFNGEYIDNWTKYDFNTFLEIDSSYGPINVLKNYNNKLFYFQDNGFGILAVEDREQISANSGIPLTLGTGAVLERYDYVSTHFGCLRDEAVLATPNNLYFVDELDKSIRVISDSDLNGNLSKIKGVSHKLQSNLLASGSDYIALGFDPRHKEVLFSFDNDTIVYSELLQQFTSMYSIFADQDRSVSPNIDFKADRYSVVKDELYIVSYDDDLEQIVASKMDGDTTTPFVESCSVTLLIHPSGNNIFTFDNLDIRSNVFDTFAESLPHDTDNVDETIQYLQFKNSYLEQSIGDGLSTPSELNRLARAWRVQVPLTDNDNRFVDSYLLVTLKYTHSGSTGDKFVLHDVTTYVRPTKNNI